VRINLTSDLVRKAKTNKKEKGEINMSRKGKAVACLIKAVRLNL